MHATCHREIENLLFNDYREMRSRGAMPSTPSAGMLVGPRRVPETLQRQGREVVSALDAAGVGRHWGQNATFRR
jgi:hypothetical protein